MLQSRETINDTQQQQHKIAKLCERYSNNIMCYHCKFNSGKDVLANKKIEIFCGRFYFHKRVAGCWLHWTEETN